MTRNQNLTHDEVFQVIDIAAQYTDSNLESLAGSSWTSLDRLANATMDYIPETDHETFLDAITRPPLQITR